MKRKTNSGLKIISINRKARFNYFFDELPIEITATKSPGLTDVKVPSFQGDPLVKRETLELVRAYYRITDPGVRKRVLELVKAVAKPASGDKSRADD